MSAPKAAGNILRALMKNPAARKAAMQVGRKAASSVAAVAAKAGQSRSSGANPEVPTGNPPPAAKAAPAFKFPLPLGGVAASVEGAINNFAKPAAERLAATSAGRSILSAVNKATAEALKSPSSSGSTGRSRQGYSAEDETRPTAKFVPVQPPPAAAAPPVETIKWPPPKRSDETSS